MILRMLRYFSGSVPAMAAVALTAFVSAGAEVVAVVSLVPLLHGLTDSSPSIIREFGPVQLELDRSELAALAIGAVVVYGLALALGVMLRARLAMGWEAAKRREIQRTFLATDWSVKALERDGHLQQVGAFATAAAQGLGRLSQLLAVSLSLCVLVLAALAVEWRSALMIAGVGLVLFTVLRPLSMRVKRRGRESGDAMLALGLEIGEVVDHVREIELYGVADRFVERMDERIEHARVARERTLIASQIVSPIYRSLGLLVVVVLVMVVTELESIDVAAFGAVALLMLRCLSYSQQFQLLHANLAEDLASIELLEEEMERYTSHRAVSGEAEADGPLRIELVGAGYSYDGVQDALTGLDLVIEPGERIGVIGVSGGGKSTLAQILTRLRSPSSGVHLVDGRPAAEYEEASWRRAVQFLPQEVKLLHGTVSDNIAFERRDVPVGAIEEAARRAGVHETVAALPQGYDTLVGTASRALSGGQVQRLGLARALVCSPRLLVLDEPTSALDADTEAAITDMLAGIDRSVTIVIIAHRLSTLTQCDRIIELAGGRIVRTGLPGELLPVIDEQAVL